MRSALWPHCTPERHVTEMRDYASRNGSFATFVAIQSGVEFCGFIEVSLRSSAEGCTSRPVGYVEGIFVWPAFRRQGVGRQLVTATQNWAASHGCVELASDCHADNEASIRFHRQLGFDIARQLIHFRRTISDATGNV